MALTSPRSETAALPSLNRTGQAVFHFDTANPSSNVTTIGLFPSSSWTSGLHWHETHTEYLQIVKGRALVTLVDDPSNPSAADTREYDPDDGVITIPRFMRHKWRAAPKTPSDPKKRVLDIDDEFPEFELVAREWTEPADGMKEVFFRNLVSALSDAGKLRYGWMVPVQLFTIFGKMDNYPVVLASRSKVIDISVTHGLIILATIVTWVLGLRAVYPEYTPKSLMDAYKSRGEKVKEL